MANTDTDQLAKQLREAAMEEVDKNLHFALRGAADLLDAAIDDFTEYRNAAALIDLNGIWAHSVKLLNLHHEPKQPQSPQTAVAQDVGQMRKAA